MIEGTAPADEAHLGRHHPPHRRSILLVDDQADEREIQRVMLEHLGYAVIEADDGESALETAHRLRPDLILLDIAMPRMDGLEVCRKLRQDPTTREIPILFFTASPAGEVEEKVEAAGGDGVLLKPIDPHLVAQRVATFIGPPHR